MRGVTLTMVMLTSTWTVAQAAAPDASYRSGDSRATTTKRQVIDCMNKRMAASRTLSYNDASRRCKDEVSELAARQQPITASATPLKAVSAP